MKSYIGTGQEVIVDVVSSTLNSEQIEAAEILRKSVQEVTYSFEGMIHGGIASAVGTLTIRPERLDAIKILDSQLLGRGIDDSTQIYCRVGYAGVNPNYKAPGYFFNFGIPQITVNGNSTEFSIPMFGSGASSTALQSSKTYKNTSIFEIFKFILSNHGFDNISVDDSNAARILNRTVSFDQTVPDYDFMRDICKRNGLDMLPDFKSTERGKYINRTMIIRSRDKENSSQPVASFVLWGSPDDTKKVFLIDEISTNMQHTQLSPGNSRVETSSINPNNKRSESEDLTPSKSTRTIVGDTVYDISSKKREKDGTIPVSLSENAIGGVQPYPSRDDEDDKGHAVEGYSDSLDSAFQMDISGPGVGFILPGDIVRFGIPSTRGMLRELNYIVAKVEFSAGSRGFRISQNLIRSIGGADAEPLGLKVNDQKSDQTSGRQAKERTIF